MKITNDLGIRRAIKHMDDEPDCIIKTFKIHQHSSNNYYTLNNIWWKKENKERILQNSIILRSHFIYM